MQTLQESLGEALAALPDITEEIAAYFEWVGIRGEGGCSTRCPLARYLTARTNADHVAVDRYHVTVSRLPIADLRLGEVVMAKLPPAACQFVWDFDTGRWPRLDETTVAAMA